MADVQSELERRLAKLRAPIRKVSPPPAPRRTPSELLEDLHPPSDEEAALHHIEVKNVTDDEVERFLASASSPPETAPISPSSDRRLQAALSSYETAAPEFSSPIEILYMKPSSEPSRTEEEDEALIRRMQDELSLEQEHGTEDEQEMDALQRRMESLKGYRAPLGSASTATPPKLGDGLGAPPTALEQDELNRASRRGRKKENDSDSSESESEEDSEEDSD